MKEIYDIQTRKRNFIKDRTYFKVVKKHKDEPFNFDFKTKDNNNLGDFKGSGILCNNI